MLPPPWAAVPPPPVLAPSQAPAPVLALSQAPAPVLAAPSPEAVEERDPHQGRRVLLSSLAGVAGAFGGAFAGGLLGLAIARPDGSWSALGGVVLGASAGYVFGLPLAVTLAGNAQGGNGGYGWALLGGFGGTLVLGGLASAVDDRGGLTGVLGIAGGVAGAVLGYELSNDAHRSPRARVSARVLPTVGADVTGLRVGLGGTF